jgi:hypothetical protein
MWFVWCTPQDVIQFRPLLLTMGQQMLQDPLTVPQLLAHVGPGGWVGSDVHAFGQWK